MSVGPPLFTISVSSRGLEPWPQRRRTSLPQWRSGKKRINDVISKGSKEEEDDEEEEDEAEEEEVPWRFNICICFVLRPHVQG